MTTIYSNVKDDAGRIKAAVAENGAQSYRRMVWEDQGNSDTAVKAAVWIAEPGVYPYPARALEETFVVMEGEADCRIGEGEKRRIGPGTIVVVPKGATAWLEVLTSFRKFAMVVPKP
ncbi:cupin domain-containing protein [Mesorhizobium atlanticum]|jgi:uncharacterized cupin superfamily protein|uniref:(S)-ureidoglycine aminohydrolase cupin domain-containing protein n=1 Tax=Mesorhizobium atlanticum TaxID=2233532 RepID=A0A330GUL3_9HYPH|nr:cupin domain-containing protein [Mesorhizobium atlanticum]RAZ76027.1 hypothetical protein DPM35_14995 [Mesorhizobium atlanticum]